MHQLWDKDELIEGNSINIIFNTKSTEKVGTCNVFLLRTRLQRAALSEPSFPDRRQPYRSQHHSLRTRNTESSSARTKSSDTGTGHSYVHLQSSGRNTESCSARTEPSDTGNKAMPSGRIFSSRLGTTGVAEFRLEIRQGFGLVSSGGRPIWINPNLRSRVSELHPDMPRVSFRKSRLLSSLTAFSSGI